MHPAVTRARHRVSDVLDQVTGALAVRLLTRVIDGQRGHSDQFRVLNASLTDLRTSFVRRFDHLETVMTDVRSEFNQTLADLGSAISQLSTRIDQLPDDANDITQDDLDAIKSLTGQVNTLAVAAPEVPTEETPAPVEGEPTPAPVEETPVEGVPAEQSGDEQL